MNGQRVTADDLYEFILANAEEIDGQLICRASLHAELLRRGIEKPQQLRIRLVRELEARGLVKRPHPRTRWLIITGETERVATKRHAEFLDRMSLGDEPGALILHTKTDHFSVDRESNRQRIHELRRYMSRNVMRDKNFVCASWTQCEGSIGRNCSFKEGQLSHVGNHYDLSRQATGLRVVVVGQEVGLTRNE